MEIVEDTEKKEEEIIRPTTPTHVISTSTGPGPRSTTPGNNNNNNQQGNIQGSAQVTTTSGTTGPTTSSTTNNSTNLSSQTTSTTSTTTGENVNPTEENVNETSQVIELREPTTRPVYRLSVKLIDTYKYINKVYYEAKARKIREQQGNNRVGIYNEGYDDQNYDYIIHGDEMFAERYILKHRIGKVGLSFLMEINSVIRAHLVKLFVPMTDKPKLMLPLKLLNQNMPLWFKQEQKLNY